MSLGRGAPDDFAGEEGDAGNVTTQRQESFE